MAGTIWFDVTRLHNWNGPLVGFVRVELEISRCLLRDFGTQTRFSRYDRTWGIHVEEPDKDIAAHIRRLAEGAETASGQVRTGPGWNMKRVARSMIRPLPERLRESIVRNLINIRNAAGKAVAIPPRLVSRLIAFVRPLPGAIEPKLKRGDVYITLGLDSETNIFPGIGAIKERTGIKVIGMCYDLIPAKFPHCIAGSHAPVFSAFLIDMARCADAVVCISRSTLRDLKEFLSDAGQDCPPLDIIELGEDIASETGGVGERVLSLCRDPFILFVSNIERRKNHDVLCRAYRKLLEMGRGDLPLLVFVGRPGWGCDDLLSAVRSDESVNRLVAMVDHVSGAELSCLYRHSLFTVYPSLYEGWGLPVAESLAHGKFCISSSASSLPEVGGEFVDYLDPRDLSGWVERLSYYFDNPEALREKEARIGSGYTPRTYARGSALIQVK